MSLYTSLQLRDLDRSSSEFPVKLGKIILRKDWENQVEELSSQDPERLVENLDYVCANRLHPLSAKQYYRVSPFSTPPMMLLTPACSNFRESVVPARSCRRHI